MTTFCCLFMERPSHIPMSVCYVRVFCRNWKQIKISSKFSRCNQTFIFRREPPTLNSGGVDKKLRFSSNIWLFDRWLIAVSVNCTDCHASYSLHGRKENRTEFNWMQKFDKSEAEVTNSKRQRSTCCTVEAKTFIHEPSRDRSVSFSNFSQQTHNLIDNSNQTKTSSLSNLQYHTIVYLPSTQNMLTACRWCALVQRLICLPSQVECFQYDDRL